MPKELTPTTLKHTPKKEINAQDPEAVKEELARRLPRALRVLDRLLRSGKPDKVKLDACNVVLDRLSPKPTRLDVEVDSTVKIILTSDLLTQLAEGLARYRGVPRAVIEAEWSRSLSSAPAVPQISSSDEAPEPGADEPRADSESAEADEA